MLEEDTDDGNLEKRKNSTTINSDEVTALRSSFSGMEGVNDHHNEASSEMSDDVLEDQDDDNNNINNINNDNNDDTNNRSNTDDKSSSSTTPQNEASLLLNDKNRQEATEDVGDADVDHHSNNNDSNNDGEDGDRVSDISPNYNIGSTKASKLSRILQQRNSASNRLVLDVSALDYEEQLQHQKTGSSSNLLQGLELESSEVPKEFSVPTDVISTEKKSRTFRTVENFLEKNKELLSSVSKDAELNGGANPNIQEFLHSLYGDQVLLVRKNKHFHDYLGLYKEESRAEAVEEEDDDGDSDDEFASAKGWSADDAVIMKGFLQKRPVFKGGRRTLTQTVWKLKNRYFQLTSGYLAYFATPNSATPLGVWALDDVQVSLEGRDTQFCLVWSEMKYLIQAENVETKQKWTDILKQQITARKVVSPQEQRKGISPQVKFAQSQLLAAAPNSLFHTSHLAVHGSGVPWLSPTEYRLAGRQLYVSAFKEEAAISITVDCRDLKFDWGSHEPFFCSLFVVDLGARIKSTENFYFDLNSREYLKQCFGDKMGDIDPTTRSRRAVFNLSKPCRDMYLVLWVDKVLQNTSSKVIKPYLKPPSKPEKALLKIDRAIKRFWAFRQPFVWGYVPLFRKMQDGFVIDEGKKTFDKLYRIEGDVQKPFDIFEFINYAEKPYNYAFVPTSLKEKLGASFTCVIRQLRTKVAANAVNSELEPLSCPPQQQQRERTVSVLPDSGDPNPVTKEILELDRPSPFSEFVHSLFVYPEALNMVNRLMSVSAVVKVMFKDTDSDPSSDGLMVFFGKSSAPKMTLCSYCQVTYKNSHPQFHDEIKIRMPLPLRPQHHLLFAFYDVHKSAVSAKSPKSSSGSAASAETMIPAGDPEMCTMKLLGYAVVPLFEEHGLPIWTEKPLDTPLMTHLPPGYMSMLPKLRSQAEREMRTFSVRVRFMSVLYPQEPRVSLFLKLQDSPLDGDHTPGSYVGMYIPTADKPRPDTTQDWINEVSAAATLLRSIPFSMLVMYLPPLVNLSLRLLSQVASIRDRDVRPMNNAVMRTSSASTNTSNLSSPGGAGSPVLSPISATRSHGGRKEAGKSGMFIGRMLTSLRRSSPNDNLLQGSAQSGDLSLIDESDFKAEYEVFISLVSVLGNVCEGRGCKRRIREPLLQEYCHRTFDNLQGRSPRIFDVILHNLVTSLEMRAKRHLIGEKQYPTLGRIPGLPMMVNWSVELSWFWFDLCIKSMVLYKASASNAKEVFGSPEMLSRLQQLGSLVRGELCYAGDQRSQEVRHLVTKEEFEDQAERYEFYYSLNRNFSLFLRDLIPIMDSDMIMVLITSHLELELDTAALKPAGQQLMLDFRRQAIEIIIDYEHILALSNPEPILRLPHPADCVKALCERFPIATRLITEVVAHLEHSEWPEKSRVLAIESLYSEMAKLDCDARFQSESSRSVIAGMHLPLIFALMGNMEVFDGDFLKQDCRMHLLLCCTHVLLHINIDLLKGWWKNLHILRDSEAKKEEDSNSNTSNNDKVRMSVTTPTAGMSMPSLTQNGPISAPLTPTGSKSLDDSSVGTPVQPPQQQERSSTTSSFSASTTLSNFMKMLRLMTETFTAIRKSEDEKRGAGQSPKEPSAASPPSSSSSSAAVATNSPISPTSPLSPRSASSRLEGPEAEVAKTMKVILCENVHKTVMKMVFEYINDEWTTLKEGGPLLDDVWSVLIVLMQHMSLDLPQLQLFRTIRELIEGRLHEPFFKPKNDYWRDMCGELLRIKIMFSNPTNVSSHKSPALRAAPSFRVARLPSMSEDSLNTTFEELCDDLSNEALQLELVGIADGIMGILTEPFAQAVNYDNDQWENEDDISDTEIKVATVDQIINMLSHHSVKPGFAIEFFLTYRSFTNPIYLLNKLIQKYVGLQKITENSQISSEDKGANRLAQLRVANALKFWVEKHFHDFDEALISCLLRFVHDYVEDANKTVAMQLTKSVQKMLQGRGELQIVHLQSAPKPHLPLNRKNATLLDWPTLEIARQLTLIEYELFRKIQPQEFIGQSWAKKGKEEKAPNILNFIQRFNTVSRWVASCIVMEEDLKARKQLVAKFHGIAKECEKCNNYNAVLEIISGLHNASIDRMKKSFEGLPEKLVHEMEELTELMSEKKSYKNFREKMQKVNPPCIPYLGVYLTDLTFIDDGNKNTNDQGLVNMHKARLLSEVIRKIQVYQQTPYNFEVVTELRKTLMSTKVLNDNEMYKLSLLREPRQAS